MKLVPDREQVEAVWRQRAVRLSRRPTVSTQEFQLHVLVLALGKERYGIEIADVAEVLPAILCTPVPGAPPVIAGVMNVRGEIRPVMDLKLILGIRNAAVPGVPAPVILLRQQAREVGVQVDQVEQIRTIAAGELRACGDETAGLSRYLKGITQDTLMLLSTEALYTEFLKDESAT